MRILIVVDTKKEYKQAREEITKELESKGIDYVIKYQDASIIHSNGKHTIDFMVEKDKKSTLTPGVTYNQVVKWRKK